MDDHRLGFCEQHRKRFWAYPRQKTRIWNGGKLRLQTSGNGAGWEAYYSRGGWKGAWNQGSVKKDEWLYMTATYDGEDTITIYENGAEIGTVSGLGGPAPRNDTDVNIGGWTDNTSETLDGMLYESRFLVSCCQKKT